MADTIILDNGITVVLDRMPYTYSICLGVWFADGSAYETHDNNGITHFIEHMLMRSLNKKWFDDLNEIGGQVNAFTTKEYTGLYIRTLNYQFDKMLSIVNNVLTFVEFGEEDINAEKRNILHEIKVRSSIDKEIAFFYHDTKVWENDPLGLPIMGTAQSVEKFNSEMVSNYYFDNYVPENMVISVVGNFNTDETLEKIRKTFDWKKGRKAALKTIDTHNYNRCINLKEADFNESKIIISFPSFSLGSIESYALKIVEKIFIAETNTNLAKGFALDRVPPYSISSLMNTHKNTGMFSMYASANNNNVNEALSAIYEKIQAINFSSFSKRSVYKVKESIKAGYLIASENVVNRAIINGKAQVLLNKVLTDQQVLDKIDSISELDIWKIQSGVFDVNKMSITVLGNVCQVYLPEMIEDAM